MKGQGSFIPVVMRTDEMMLNVSPVVFEIALMLNLSTTIMTVVLAVYTTKRNPHDVR